jgi:hypothetical protein
MSTDDQNAQSPFTSPKFVMAAVLIAIIVILGLVLAIVNATRDDDAPSGSTSTSPTEGTSSPEAEPTATPVPPVLTKPDDVSACGLEALETTGTLTVAPEVEWGLLGTTAVPSSTTAGPGVLGDDGLRACFQHTPEGALLATANYFAMSATADTRKALVEGSVLEGPGRDALLALVATEESPSAEDSPAGPEIRVQIQGFKILYYDGASATVDIAYRGSNGALAAQAYELKWHDGDWKLVVRDNGDPPTSASLLSSLADYVTWSGV